MAIQPEQPVHDEIAELEKKLAEKKASLGSSSEVEEIEEHANHKEALHSVVGENLFEKGKERASVSASTTDTDDDEDEESKPKTAVKGDAGVPLYERPEIREKVQDLVSYAFAEGIGKAVKKARATNDAALVDAFHDVLVDELYDYLVEQGKLPKI